MAPFDSLSPPPQEETTKEQLTPPLTDVQRVLLRAAEIIEERGWCRAAYIENGRLCAVGAIATAAEGNAFSLAPRVERAIRSFNDFIGGSVRIEAWNDAPGRTQSEIVNALRSAALRSASLRAGGEQK
jgi:hypothetical protein